MSDRSRKKSNIKTDALMITHRNKVFDETKNLWNDSQDVPEFLLRLARLGYINVPSVPYVVILALTERCHGRCVYCSAATAPYAKRKELMSKEWTDVLDSLARAGVSEIVLSGGEPLLREDFCDILEDAASHFYRVQILTSGTFPKPHETIQNIRNIIRRYDSQLYIQVDVDSLREEIHNTLRPGCQLETVKKNLNELLKIKHGLSCEIWINTVATRYNLFDIPNLITFFNKMSVDGVKIIPMALVGKAIYMKDIALTTHEKIILFNTINQMTRKEDLKIKVYYKPIEAGLSLMQKTQKYNEKRMIKPLCSAAYLSCVVTSDGRICPCDLVISYDSMRGEKVLEHDFRSLWRNSTILKKWREEIASIKECANCPVLDKCFNGCKAETLALLGTLRSKYPFCPVMDKNEQ
ncbi:MAG: radical SAM protein [Candidatus Brockarchaeota archaeon]|nr:radical SAM protein [Candidatus Brockarchaeota archaeon]